MKHVLCEAGLDVQHEYCAGDGTVSLFFCGDFDHYPVMPVTSPPRGLNAHVGQKFRDFEFEHVFHQVRHPLKCIPSMAVTLPRAILNWWREVGIVKSEFQPRLLMCAHAWYETNLRAEEIAEFRYKIEELPSAWPKIARRLGLGGLPMPDVTPKHRASGNRRRGRDVTWDTLSCLDATLTRDIRRMARRYGYDVE
jgi:hypothetical protein